MILRVQLLGTVALYCDGIAITLGAAKRRALLAALALNANHTIQAVRLIAAAWTDPPPSALANVRTHLSALRRTLDDRITAVGSGYRLLLYPGELDVEAFQTLVGTGRAALATGEYAVAARELSAALRLWHGVAGQGLPEGSSLDPIFAGLEEQRLAAVEDHAQARVALGEYAAAVPELRQHLRAYPLRERAWAQLVVALHRAGDTASAVDAYREAVGTIRTELGLDPGTELARAYREVVDRCVAEDAHVPPVPGTSGPGVAPGIPAAGGAGRADRACTPTWPVPHQLPPDPAVIVGRDQQLNRIVAAITAAASAAPPVVIVSGPGGVGKSVLAVRAAHRTAALFPDGQVILDLHPDPPTVPAPAAHTLLGHVLSTLGVDRENIPTRTADRAATLRSLTAGRRLLVMLDDAAGTAQVRPFVPVPSGTVLLVTTHRRMATLDAARRIALAPPDETTAIRLLAAYAGQHRVDAEPGAAIELVHRCGRLPLALRIAATRLACEPDLTVADLVARMAAGNPLDALSYDDLSVRDRLTADLAALTTENALTVAALRALGRLPAQGVPAAQVATLINVSTPAVQAALDALVDARIVSRHADRYRLPLLSRAYAGVPLDGAVEPFGGQGCDDTPALPGADRASVAPVAGRPNKTPARRGCVAGPRPEPALATAVTRAASARD